MEAELAKVMKTGLLLHNTTASVSADAFRRLSPFGKRMMTDRMRETTAADRKFRDDERERERGRMRVMAPGVASAISRLRGVEAETRARNVERLSEMGTRAIEREMRAASEEREAAGVARSRSGLPVRAVPAIPMGKKNAIKITDFDTLKAMIAAAGLRTQPRPEQLEALRYNLESGRFSGFNVHMTPSRNLVFEAILAPGAATGGAGAAAPAMREAVKEAIAGLSADEKKALVGIKRRKMMSVEDALAEVLKANGYDSDSGEADYEFMSGSEDEYADAVIKKLTRMGMTRRQMAMSAAEMDEGYTMFDDLVKEFPEAYRIRKAMKGAF
jgi:hypothetical protein